MDEIGRIVFVQPGAQCPVPHECVHDLALALVALLLDLGKQFCRSRVRSGGAVQDPVEIVAPLVDRGCDARESGQQLGRVWLGEQGGDAGPVRHRQRLVVAADGGVEERLELPILLPPVPDLVDFAETKVLIADDVADTGATHKEDGPRHIRRFMTDVSGAKLSGGEIFAESTAGLFDGFRVDRNGRVWTSTAEGVYCYDADGSLIGKILIPEMISNVTFGGAKLNRLFICGTTSLYSIYVTANGSKLG